MIGKAYVSVFKFYNSNTKKMEFKNRPVLIIGQADSSDYVILPISRITNQNNIDSYYDVPINPTDVPLMNLTQRSYIRTHKQSVVHSGELTKAIVDFRNEYEELYLDVISKMEEFQKNLISKAL
ncbi:MAG: hypothetical protein IJE49_04990 [Agathobacter sp.]|nr:hypothetical protein [Agathobacter sp.]